MAAGLVALALVAVAVPVLAPDSAEGLDGDDPGVELPVTADPVDGGPVLTALPERCGLSESTLKALAPEPGVHNAGDFGTCEWMARKDPVLDHHLQVELTVKGADMSGVQRVTSGALTADGRPGLAAPVPMSPQAAAVGAISPKYSNVEMSTVTGLGDEAITGHTLERTILIFRVRNVTGTVTYKLAGPDGLSDMKEFQGAVRAASDVARSLGKPVSAAPKQLPSAKAPKVGAEPSKICDLVPAAVLERVMKGKPSAREGGMASEPTGVKAVGVDTAPKSAGCTWKSGHREMAVVTKTIPDSKVDRGTRLATGEYLMQHFNARAEQPLASKGKKYFTALSGLGEQAFGSYVAESTPARVVFRKGNVLVEASFVRSDGREPADGKRAVAAAYAAAVHVAKAL